MTRYFYILIYCLLMAIALPAQYPCGTKTKGKLIHVDSAAAAQRWQQYRTTATLPLIIKLYIVVFANDNGTGVSATDNSIRLDLDYMRAYYAQHDICFVLSAIEHVNSTDLNTQDVDNEEDELDPYLRDGYLCLFFHKSVVHDDGSHVGGHAYGIPGLFLSIDGDELDDQHDIIAHEVGHCFGLYHTFESAHGEENVARTGSCRDCDGDGDLLCDTPADRESEPEWIDPSTCEYTALSMYDDCNVRLTMATTNIMSYGRPSCRTHFTTAQGGRARDFIIDPLGDLIDCIAADVRTVTNVINYSSGFVSAMARVIVSFESLSFTTSGSARLYSSAQEIVVKPGTEFNPGSGGVTELRPNTYCQ